MENEENNPSDTELSLIDHLDELRNRLIITAVAFVVFFIGSFVFVKKIYLFFTKNLQDQLIVLGPSDIMWIYFKIAAVIAIALTIPVLAVQIWLFVKPALKKHEQKAALSYIPALFLLFIAGLAFGYFLIFPFLLNFLTDLGSDITNMSYTVERYFKFLINICLPFGILFELPIVMMFLTSLGILNPFILVKLRKYAYFVLIVIAVVISPPEMMSDIIVSIPLLLLYEISINLSKIVYKRKLKKEALSEEYS